MIKGVLIPFDNDYPSISMKDLAKEIRDKTGYETDIVLMENETYDIICTKNDEVKG